MHPSEMKMMLTKVFPLPVTSSAAQEGISCPVAKQRTHSTLLAHG